MCIDFVHKITFLVRRACTKSYVTSEPYPRASQMWCQNVRETRKKIEESVVARALRVAELSHKMSREGPSGPPQSN